jgi:hypothetical protein
MYTVLYCKEAHQEFGDFKKGGQAVRRVKYAYDLAFWLEKNGPTKND